MQCFQQQYCMPHERLRTSRFMTSTVKRDAISGPPTAQDNMAHGTSLCKKRLYLVCAHQGLDKQSESGAKHIQDRGAVMSVFPTVAHKS